MLATLCSKPHRTNRKIGPKRDTTFPPADWAQNAIHTARHTRKLHSTPRSSAAPKGSAAFVKAVDTAASATPFSAPHRATRKATATLPNRFPR